MIIFLDSRHTVAFVQAHMHTSLLTEACLLKIFGLLNIDPSFSSYV